MYANTTPRIYSWLGISSGLRGVGYNCAVGKNSTQAEIYIDRGKKPLKKTNRFMRHSKKIKIKLRKHLAKIFNGNHCLKVGHAE